MHQAFFDEFLGRDGKCNILHEVGVLPKKILEFFRCSELQAKMAVLRTLRNLPERRYLQPPGLHGG